MRRFVLALTLALCLSFTGTALAKGTVTSFNKATAEQLVEALDGIVDADMAKAIVAYRTQNGPFKKADDLNKVPGMRPVIYNSIVPTVVDGDVVYENEVSEGMHAY